MKKTITVFFILVFLAECISGMDNSDKKKSIEKHVHEISKIIEVVRMLCNERYKIIKQLNLERLITDPHDYVQQIKKAEQCIAVLTQDDTECINAILEQLGEHYRYVSILELGFSADIERLKEQLKKNNNCDRET